MKDHDSGKLKSDGFKLSKQAVLKVSFLFCIKKKKKTINDKNKVRWNRKIQSKESAAFSEREQKKTSFS